MQVVTSENFATLVETGKVPEFKAPDAKAEVVIKDNVITEPADRPRGPDGKFLSVEETKAAEPSEVTTDKAAPAAADDEDQEDKDLPERVRKQIGKKHRQMKEAEEFGKQSYLERLAAEKRAEKAEQELEALRNPKSRPNQDNEPKPEDFKTVAEYTDALVDYKFAKKEQAEQQRRNEAAQAKAQAEFIERLNVARKEIPDFDEVCAEADQDVVPHVASYIAESDLGPKLGYHFAKHPEDLDRIQKLSPIRAIAELGKLETRLEKKPEAEKPAATAPVSVSKAPSPITPVDASNKAIVQKDPAKMTLQELREYDRQQREAKRR